ncbi:MAG TPA: response regulator transcription factor [Chloroflexota bacterium]|nr:response regulator transcription factor [Chloroflexota bacterium]
MNVLVVEDDPRVARVVERGLRDAGHRVAVANDGVTGLAQALGATSDVIVLDVMLPKLDGLALCRELRQQGVSTPVLMLTARDAIPDRVRGLDAGADDYLTKPFALEELLARIRALGRRATAEQEDEILTFGNLRLDVIRHEVTRGERRIDLTLKEFRLLEYLMRNAGRVLSRAQIADHVWGYDTDNTSNVVDTYVHYLRNKVDRDSPRPLIRTIRGLGYTLKE